MIDEDMNSVESTEPVEEVSKRDLILSTYISIIEEQGSVSMVDMVDAGYTKDMITHHFRSLKRLNAEARAVSADSFFDVSLDDIVTDEFVDILNDSVSQYKRFIVTTAVIGCRLDQQLFQSMKTYCAQRNAHILVLVAADPARNGWSPDAKYGCIDRQLVNDPDVTIVVADVDLNTNLSLSTVKLSAKHVDPATSMCRIASKDGSFIFASPKQRLKAVPVSNLKCPHFVMTTGAITSPDYNSSNYMSDRSAFIASHDHIMGGLIVEIEDADFYHFRQFQMSNNGSLIDLGVRYQPDGNTEAVRPEALVMGDWHSGLTDLTAKAAWKEICVTTNVKNLFAHDMFDGLSINHHERDDVVIRAKRVLAGEHDLRSEMELFTSDINDLCEWVDQLVIVKSNHDEFLHRYLSKGYYVKDPQNHRYALDLAAAAIDKLDPLKFAAEQIGINHPAKVKWLCRNDDFKIQNIQLAAHGDIGPNGSRGTIRGMETSYGTSVTGHSHTPEILRGAFQVGCSCYLKLDYNRGPSSWLHTSCLVYPCGARQLINSIEGKWCMKDVVNVSGN